jgi:hypothetical protein
VRVDECCSRVRACILPTLDRVKSKPSVEVSGHIRDTLTIRKWRPVAKSPRLLGFCEGDDRNRTGVHGFAGRCVATPPRRQVAPSAYRSVTCLRRLLDWVGSGGRLAPVQARSTSMSRAGEREGRASRQATHHVARAASGYRSVDTLNPCPGRLAQLGERRLDKAEVTGSSPVSPITEKPC